MEPMPLYEINANLRKLLQEGFACDEETGEVTFEGEGDLQALQMAREEKVISCAKVLAEMRNAREAYAEQRKALAKRMQAREQQMEKREEYLRSYIERNTTAGEKFNDGVIAVSWRKVNSVEVTCAPESLPAIFQQVKQTYSADKVALKAALEGGQVIPGAMLMQRLSLQVK